LSGELGKGLDELVERGTALWLLVAPGGSPPYRVETLKSAKRKSAVLRLVGAGPNGQSVVAKRAPSRSIQREAHVYLRVLPELAVPAPCLLGQARDGEVSWLFLEDVGDTRFDPDRAGDRRLAAIWMARAHGGARSLPAVADLPARDSRHYLALLRSVDSLLQEAFANPALSNEEVAVVDGLLEACRSLRSRWPAVAEELSEAPATIAFGGFGGKNARIRSLAGEPLLLPFDFESTGHGCPAIDLVHCDGETYVGEAGRWWRDLDLERFVRLQGIGNVLGGLKAVPGERSLLVGSSPSKAVAKLRWYCNALKTGMTVAGAQAGNERPPSEAVGVE
jgi:Phosphotransferase enzyme family